MDIFLVQMAIARGKPELNRSKVNALTAGIRPDKDALVILPELFSTGYIEEADAAGLRADLAREDEAFLGALARRLGCRVAGTTVEARPGGAPNLLNVSLMHDGQGALLSRYAKIHPFSYAGEDRAFARGNEVVTLETGGWIIQPTVCYDLRFPELYRAGSQRGAHLILVQANWPQARMPHWETLLKARAIENQAWVAGVNCAGEQGPLRYAGGSLLVSPKGEVAAQAGSGEEVVMGRADLDFCKQWRKQFPALRDRSDLFILPVQ